MSAPAIGSRPGPLVWNSPNYRPKRSQHGNLELEDARRGRRAERRILQPPMQPGTRVARGARDGSRTPKSATGLAFRVRHPAESRLLVGGAGKEFPIAVPRGRFLTSRFAQCETRRAMEARPL
jgi:hypothetical protein